MDADTMTESAAQKIAKSIYQELMLPKTSLKYGDSTELIVKALTQYADERVKEAWEDYRSMLNAELEHAREKALEEAAKIAEIHEDGDICHGQGCTWISEHIRSLATELRGKAK